jgi:hypothetical protein
MSSTITKSLSDRLYERTGLPLFGWISGTVAVLGFALALFLALWK